MVTVFTWLWKTRFGTFTSDIACTIATNFTLSTVVILITDVSNATGWTFLIRSTAFILRTVGFIATLLSNARYRTVTLTILSTATTELVSRTSIVRQTFFSNAAQSTCSIRTTTFAHRVIVEVFTRFPNARLRAFASKDVITIATGFA